jgi:FAD/FMN-containing dehydrogenase
MKPRFPRLSERSWNNREGSVVCRPRFIATPAVLEQIQAEVARAAESGTRLRVAGRGHANAPLCWSDDGILQLTRFTGIESVDAVSRRVWVRAGTRLAALADALDRYGLALPTIGWAANETVGGALSVGSYGIGTPDGREPSPVTGLRMVDAKGVLRSIGNDDRELLSAARVGLGTLGVITHVEFRCVPASPLRLSEHRLTLSETLMRLSSLRRHRYFEFDWFPHDDLARVRLLRPAVGATPPRHLARVRERLTTRAAKSLAGGKTRRLPGSQRVAAALMARRPVAPAKVVAAQNLCRIFPPSVISTVEYALPTERLGAVLAHLARMLRATRYPAPVPPRVRFSIADDAALSPADGQDTAYVRIPAHPHLDSSDYFEAVSDILDRADARPLWSTPHQKEATDLAHLYPRWGEFALLRAEYDPEGLFLNPYLESLFGIPNERET